MDHRVVETSVGTRLVAAQGIAPPLGSQSGRDRRGMVQVGHRTHFERAVAEERRSAKD